MGSVQGHGGGDIFQNNRLADIAQAEKVLAEKFGLKTSYKYVPTEENPSDLLTRGVSYATFLKKIDFWLKGPRWLGEVPVVWPSGGLQCLRPEHQKLISCHNQIYISPATPIVPFEKHSSFSKLLRITQLCFKFISLRLRRPDWDCHKKALTYLYKIHQQRFFQAEIDHLGGNNQGGAPARITALGLFLDDHGLLRCRGRLGHASIFPEGVKIRFSCTPTGD